MAGTGGDLTNTAGGISPFDTIKHHDEGGDYWSARELATLLGYRRWEAFPGVIHKAETACEQSGQVVSDHFRHVTKLITAGKGAQREIEDVLLSRYACYLIVQNGDPTKEAVALGQTYFAVRTRQDEVNAEIDEMRQRVAERDKLARYRKTLYKTARAHGVIAPQDFAVFENHGYQGLYHETAEEILARKGLRPTSNPADYMGVLETAANGFRVALANELLATQPPAGKDTANATHHRAGAAVRQTMEDMGVPTPERLPTPAQSIQQVRRELARQKRVEAEDRLGLWSRLGQYDQDDEDDQANSGEA